MPEPARLKYGDWVLVKPEHDIPPMFRPNGPTRGRVAEIYDAEGQLDPDGDHVEVWVPIDGADVDEHSQAVFYPAEALEVEALEVEREADDAR